MTTIVCMIAVVPETVIAFKELRTMRIGPGMYAPAIIAQAALGPRSREVALAPQVLEADTAEERTKLRDDIISQVKTMFANYEATHVDLKKQAVDQHPPGGSAGQQPGKELRQSMEGSASETPAGASSGS